MYDKETAYSAAWTFTLAFVLPIARLLFGWTPLDHWLVWAGILLHPPIALAVGIGLTYITPTSHPGVARLLDAAVLLMFALATLPFFLRNWVAEGVYRLRTRGDR
jgi:hypothetical protein